MTTWKKAQCCTVIIAGKFRPESRRMSDAGVVFGGCRREENRAYKTREFTVPAALISPLYSMICVSCKKC